MRKQLAAANWKMNLTLEKAESLLKDVLAANINPTERGEVVLAVPFPYLPLALNAVRNRSNYAVAAQNCSNQQSGAYTGEVSVEMLSSLGVNYCIVGHSERREYYGEINEIVQQKLERCLQAGITPIFCCGEALAVREKGKQNDFVRSQLEASLFALSDTEIKDVVIAYEPIWAIGTGKTATTEQAQQMHAFLRSLLAEKWGAEVAEAVTILYGGSVKASNAAELFGCADVDGGLVGGASLVASEFIEIIKALKH